MESYRPSEEQIKIINNLGYKNLNQFSKAIGMDRNNIVKYLCGQKNPTLEKCMNWCKAANTDLYTIASLFYPNEINEMKGEIRK